MKKSTVTDLDGFTLVNNRGKRKPRSTIGLLQNGERKFEILPEPPDIETLYNQILDSKHELLNSEFYSGFESALESAKVLRFIETVCYGLGQFGTCRSSMYQLALLLCIKDMFNVTPDVYDPIFTKTETEVLKRFGCTVPDNNEEGKRSTKAATLFYMPHCGKPLYNSVLWANWTPEKLAKMAVIGNSFSTMCQSLPRRILEREVWYLPNVLPATLEEKIPNRFKLVEVFNDLSLHVFPKEQLEKLPPQLWNVKEEPRYSETDEIICAFEKISVKD